MKKNVLFLALILSVSSLTMAQTFNSAIEEDVAAPLPSVGRSIVRNWNDDFVFSYHSDGVKSTFVCTKVSDFSSPYYAAGPNIDEYYYHIPISPSIWINDIKIVKDYAFFCGWEVISPSLSIGIIGAIYLPDFIMGTFNYHYHQILQTLELKQMVAYDNGGRYKVVAIGTKQLPSLSSNNCAVEIDDPQNPSPSNYDYRDFYSSATYSEFINDIVCTDHTITFVGVIISSTNGYYPSYRASADKSAVLSDPSFDILHVMPYSFESSGIHPQAVHLKENLIAVSYLHDDGTGSFSSRLRVIDVASNINTNSQEMSIDLKDEPIELAYSSEEDQMALLHHLLNLTGGTSQFSFWHPFATISYYADITYYSKPFYSIDIFRKTNLVSTGGNLWYLQDMLSFSNRSCPPLTSRKIQIIAPLNINSYTIPVSAPSFFTIPQTPTGSSMRNALLLNCSTSN